MTGYWVVFYFLACGELLVGVNAEVATAVCDCGVHGKCSFDQEDTKHCTCDIGYSVNKQGSCEQCDCGVNGKCSFDEGNNKKCDCFKGYEVNSNNTCHVACGGKECQNGALKCNADNKCDCQEGWTGDACAEVLGCEGALQTICNELALECMYDRRQKEAICKCLHQENEKFNGTHCIDKCSSNPCKNDGVCIVVNGTDYLCECKQPFSGNHCERHPCHSNPCSNDGTCIAVEKTYGCVCDEPFYGRHCENDPCTPSPCKNAGLCEVIGIDFNCTCKAPYFGKQCEIEIDTTEADNTSTDHITTVPVTTRKTECHCWANSISCRLDERGNKLCFCKDGYAQRRGTDICTRTCQSNADCRNEGICERDGPGYFCMCPEPFIGERCELDVCNSVRFGCRSLGAECVRQGNVGVCKCPIGKKMSLLNNYCEDVCTSATCIHGTCELEKYGSTVYKCNCFAGYSGRHCEYGDGIHIYSPAITIIVILASGILLFSITSIIAGCWVKKLRKKIEENAKRTEQP